MKNEKLTTEEKVLCEDVMGYGAIILGILVSILMAWSLAMDPTPVSAVVVVLLFVALTAVATAWWAKESYK